MNKPEESTSTEEKSEAAEKPKKGDRKPLGHTFGTRGTEVKK